MTSRTNTSPEQYLLTSPATFPRPAGFVERVAVFVDGHNFRYATYYGLNLRVDFVKLLQWLAGGCFLIRAYYYTGEWDDEGIEAYVRLLGLSGEQREAKRQELLAQRDDDRRFLRFLNRNGYHVVTKPVRVFRDAQGEIHVKANLDIELAIDMLSLADRCDKQVLVSGDGDFAPLVKAVASRGVRVVVVSTQHEEAARRGYRASDLLIDVADEFVRIEEIREFIERR